MASGCKGWQTRIYTSSCSVHYFHLTHSTASIFSISNPSCFTVAVFSFTHVTRTFYYLDFLLCFIRFLISCSVPFSYFLTSFWSTFTFSFSLANYFHFQLTTKITFSYFLSSLPNYDSLKVHSLSVSLVVHSKIYLSNPICLYLYLILVFFINHSVLICFDTDSEIVYFPFLFF